VNLVDSFGLATNEEIRKAVAVLKCAYPSEYEKSARSITMVNMGESGTGMTDWFNNITLNSMIYGDGNTSMGDELRGAFLQTMAHEMLHVNQSPIGRFFTIPRMSWPVIGIPHLRLDEKADAMVTTAIANQYNSSMKNGDTGCACVR